MIDAAAIGEALAAIGVRSGDTALVHSDAIVAAQLPPLPDAKRLDLLIEALQASVGSEGTLVMPTFSYSFTKNETYDVLNTPSTVGMLTEHFRTQTDVCRSADAIFSVAARGSGAEELCAASGERMFRTTLGVRRFALHECPHRLSRLYAHRRRNIRALRGKEQRRRLPLRQNIPRHDCLA